MSKLKNKISSKKWKEANRAHVNEQQRLWRKANPLSIEQRLAVSLRTRLNKAISIESKTGSAVGDLGCSIAELKVYLEAKFLPGMTWENRGLKGWHIDHIVPLSAFNLTNPEEFKKACHYTNLQPMWWDENIRKGGF